MVATLVCLLPIDRMQRALLRDTNNLLCSLVLLTFEAEVIMPLDSKAVKLVQKRMFQDELSLRSGTCGSLPVKLRRES